MRFCPENVTIHDIWINHGISSCFLETVTSSIVSLFILIFGFAQLIFYYRFATRIEHLPWNKLYSLQVFSHVILILIACLDILLRHVLFKRPVLGFEVSFYVLNCYEQSQQTSKVTIDKLGISKVANLIYRSSK